MSVCVCVSVVIVCQWVLPESWFSFCLVLFLVLFRMVGFSKPVKGNRVSTKVFTCDTCAFQTFEGDEMKGHVERCHTCRCLTCGHQFGGDGAIELLRAHIEDMHGEVLYCLICGGEERQTSNFKGHFEKHHSWEVYSPSKFSKHKPDLNSGWYCSSCGVLIGAYSKMKIHLRRNKSCVGGLGVTVRPDHLPHSSEEEDPILVDETKAMSSLKRKAQPSVSMQDKIKRRKEEIAVEKTSLKNVVTVGSPSAVNLPVPSPDLLRVMTNFFSAAARGSVDQTAVSSNLMKIVASLAQNIDKSSLPEIQSLASIVCATGEKVSQGSKVSPEDTLGSHKSMRSTLVSPATTSVPITVQVKEKAAVKSVPPNSVEGTAVFVSDDQKPVDEAVPDKVKSKVDVPNSPMVIVLPSEENDDVVTKPCPKSVKDRLVLKARKRLMVKPKAIDQSCLEEHLMVLSRNVSRMRMQMKHLVFENQELKNALNQYVRIADTDMHHVIFQKVLDRALAAYQRGSCIAGKVLFLFFIIMAILHIWLFIYRK